jgi:hypothetical protein
VPPENENVIIERRRAPERPAFSSEFTFAENVVDAAARWKIKSAVDVP